VFNAPELLKPVHVVVVILDATHVFWSLFSMQSMVALRSEHVWAHCAAVLLLWKVL
jgi:hypothetical protein